MEDQLNVVILGSSYVGKTAIANCLVRNVFIEFYHPTIEDNYRKNYVIDGKSYLVNFIDTSGSFDYLVEDT